jgi:hypothetical protein
MRNLKNSWIKIGFLVVGCCLTLLGASAVWADNGTRVYLQPVEKRESGLMTVDVMVENVTDLYGLELHLKYTPEVLEAQDVKADQDGVQVEPGTLLPVSQGFVVANQVNQAEGKVTYAITLLNPAPPVSGSGPVARLTFKVLQNASSTIEVEQVTLVSASLETIAAQTSPLIFGEAEQRPVQVNAAPPVASDTTFPWWLVAAAVLVLGLLAVAVVVVLKNTRQPAASPTPTNQTPAPRSSSRPSAFK